MNNDLNKQNETNGSYWLAPWTFPPSFLVDKQLYNVLRHNRQHFVSILPRLYKGWFSVWFSFTLHFIFIYDNGCECWMLFLIYDFQLYLPPCIFNIRKLKKTCWIRFNSCVYGMKMYAHVKIKMIPSQLTLSVGGGGGGHAAMQISKYFRGGMPTNPPTIVSSLWPPPH